MIMNMFPNLVRVNCSKNSRQDSLGQSWLQPRKQDLILDFPFFICGVNISKKTIIFSEKIWRNHWTNNNPLKFMRFNNRFNLPLPKKIIGIIKLFSYGVWKKLGGKWEGICTGHCESVTGSGYHIEFWYEREIEKT